MSQQKDNRDFIAGYLEVLVTQRKLSPQTVVSYRRDLDELLDLSGNTSFIALTHFDLRRFATKLHAKGLNARSIARKLSAWRGFFDWLSEQTILPSNPVAGIRAPKRSNLLPKALSADDAVRLVSTDTPGKDANASSELCNHAMFELLYSSGLRVSELVSLDVQYTNVPNYTSHSWLDCKAGEVFVTGKGSRVRSVPVGSHALVALVRWIEERSTLVKANNIDSQSALFLTGRGTRMSVRLAQLRLKAHAIALDIPTNVHPHVLRHSFASHVLQSSGDLRAVQEMLGHASITATQVYTALDFQRLAQVYDAAHPRAKKKADEKK